MNVPLWQNIKKRIDDIVIQAQELERSGATKEAWAKYLEALDEVPEPKTERSITTRILWHIGNVAFMRKSFAKAKDALEDAVRCPGGLGDVGIHLRLGQCNFELGDERRAADNLARAYMGGGREAFANEDPKYFALLERVLKPPKGMDRLP